MSTQPAVPAVTRTELRAAADTLAMTLSDAELDMYASFMAGLTADFNLIAGLEAPRLPVKYPRGNGHRPGTDENPYNAWYRK